MVFDSKIDPCKGCGAQVSSFVTYCPFCGLDMVKAKVEPLEEAKPAPSIVDGIKEQESLASLYNPPYVARDKSGIGVGSGESAAPEAPEEQFYFQQTVPRESAPILPPTINREPAVETPEPVSASESKTDRGYLIPMSLMLIGSQFLTLALLIALFSKQGMLTLQWKTSTSFLFFLLSIPLLTLGFKWLGFSKKEVKAEKPIALDLSR